ncbi:tRNA-U16,U17-dihydrouridine synthase [Tahibacter aquaticus]|uniref:tRNA-dihydrouridine(20/20a) synthase n=1 Tax=Tahibacter aquaticus TaxID=520092 RepID=A0A4R6YSF9_9GAMM|nr:tRNA dihydrouridine(20/20a) synthase DusA [Tahibacter aquaticus]TDR41123.1 tRNA-U16,U17-dihydrouridine synthase [Tahibacter aquaticus]
MNCADWRISVAPMMEWTDRHCRYFHRMLSPHARLYTEMVTAAALLHGKRGYLLRHSAFERPVALQLGGAEPEELAQAARYGAEAGYAEINLNVGCPSDRVQMGRFGACLMREPALVADCVSAMREAVPLPVTVKCRIGVDEQDDYADLQRFTEHMVGAGVGTLVVHARKAWLQGLSPRENREIPPLNYARVYQLKKDFPQLCIVINGGIVCEQTTLEHLQQVDGVMIGRAAYHDPYVLARVEHAVYGEPLPDRDDILRRMLPYIENELERGTALKHITRHLLGLYQGLPGARGFRRVLSEQAHREKAGIEVILAALEQRDALRAAA